MRTPFGYPNCSGLEPLLPGQLCSEQTWGSWEERGGAGDRRPSAAHCTWEGAQDLADEDRVLAGHLDQWFVPKGLLVHVWDLTPKMGGGKLGG